MPSLSSSSSASTLFPFPPHVISPFVATCMNVTFRLYDLNCTTNTIGWNCAILPQYSPSDVENNFAPASEQSPYGANTVDGPVHQLFFPPLRLFPFLSFWCVAQAQFHLVRIAASAIFFLFLINEK